MAFFTFGIFVASLTSLREEIGYWLIYLTNWGVLGLAIKSALALAAAIERLLHQRNGNLMSNEEVSQQNTWRVNHHCLFIDGNIVSEMTVLTKLSWFSYNVMTMVAIVITIIYWSALYKPGKNV